MKTDVLQDEDGQIQEAHSISAGLDYPGVGPEHAYLNSIGRASYVGATDDDALYGFAACSQLEGIIPALESAHAIGWLLRNGEDLISQGASVIVTMSGRGDKDANTIHLEHNEVVLDYVEQVKKKRYSKI